MLETGVPGRWLSVSSDLTLFRCLQEVTSVVTKLPGREADLVP
jgi:hypothetical protein